MKKYIACALGLLIFSDSYAQSSVTLYGLIDTGITYVSNSGGNSKLYEDSGIANGNRFGFSGTENLGGGIKALFILENGFNATTGAPGNNGAIFGRRAFIGLSSETWGTLTMGRHNDFMVDLFYYTNFGYQGLYAAHAYDIDRISGDSVLNSVKYVSPTYWGVTVGALYGFSNTTDFGGSSGNPRGISFGAKFEGFGPLSAVVAYTNIDGSGPPGNVTTAENLLGATQIRTAGAGILYTLPKAGSIYSSITNTRATGQIGGAHTSVTMIDAGARYGLATDTFVSPSYTLGRLSSARYSQFNLSLDYLLSKRTDVYFAAYYQKSMSAGLTAGLTDISSLTTLNLGNSVTDKQLAFRLALRTHF